MKTSDRILIIYNPNSTGGKSSLKALKLGRQLARRKFTNVSLEATQYSGHGEELAYKEALKHQKTLIVSVSGDGGYSEVINGLIRAKKENKKSKAVCAILAAGNANDHRRATYKQPLIRAILNSEPEPIDVICLEFGGKKHYAHSYFGIGVTGETVAELNKEKLTRWKEMRIVVRNILNVGHFSMTDSSGKTKKYFSVVFSNIARMSKVVRIDKTTKVNDGKFVMATIDRQPRLKAILFALKLVIVGAKDFPKMKNYEFSLKKPQIGQLDGEVIALPANIKMKVTIERGLIKTLR